MPHNPASDPMQRYAVHSYANDEQQILLDFVEARDEDAAAKIILKLRPYVMHAEAYRADYLLEDLKKFIDSVAPEWKEGLRSLKKEWIDTWGRCSS